MSFGCVFALYLLLSPGQLRDNVSRYGHTCVVEIERRLWGPNEGYFTGRCETCRRSVSFDMQSVLLEDSPRLVSVSTLHQHRIHTPRIPGGHPPLHDAVAPLENLRWDPGDKLLPEVKCHLLQD